MRRDLASIYVCMAVSLIAIASATFTSINGSHTWRQSDVYAQLLGILDRNNLSGMVNFFGEQTFYDVPVYQVLVGALSLPFTEDVLAFSRIFNALLWLGFFFVSVTYAEKVQKGAGKYCALLFCTSQLLIHYFSTPLPDILASAFCMIALFLIHAADSGRWTRIPAIALFIIAAAIKSPVAFVFFIFLATMSALEFLNTRKLYPTTLALTILLPPVAIGAEVFRKIILDRVEGPSGFARSPDWYFGDLALRLSSDFWSIFAGRNLITPYLSPMVGVFVCVCAFVLFFHSRFWRSRNAPVLLSAFVACMSGWLVFSNLYFIHDYYYIPGVILLLFSLAVVFGHAEDATFRDRALPRLDYAICVAAVIALPVLVFQNPIRDLTRVSQYEVLSFMLRGEEKVLLVHDDYKPKNPDFGGFVERRFQQVSSDEFLDRAEMLSSEFQAIVVHDSSTPTVGTIEGFSPQKIGVFSLWMPTTF